MLEIVVAAIYTFCLICYEPSIHNIHETRCEIKVRLYEVCQ